MELNEIRIAWTVVSFLVFIAIVSWAYSRGAKRGFDEAARLPLEDEAPESHSQARDRADAREKTK